MAANAPSTTALRVSTLSQKGSTPFSLRPEAEILTEIKNDLGLNDLRKLSFAGQIRALGKTDWELTGRLGATVVQSCVVTLAPVTTRIDTDVKRKFIADWDQPDEPEAEMPEDDEAEPLGTWIDPAVVMVEALALSLPDYPRAEDAAMNEQQFTEPGKKAMTDEDARPFAGLAALKDKLDSNKPD